MEVRYLEDLPDELLAQILQETDVRSFANLGATSTRLNTIYRDERVYNDQMTRNIQQREERNGNGDITHLWSQYPDGRYHGVEEIYDDEGQLVEYNQWVAGKREGTCLEVDKRAKNGNIYFSLVPYHNDLIDGVVIGFLVRKGLGLPPSGILLLDSYAEYSDGVLNGTYIDHEVAAFYVDGLREGPAYGWGKGATYNYGLYLTEEEVGLIGLIVEGFNYERWMARKKSIPSTFDEFQAIAKATSDYTEMNWLHDRLDGPWLRRGPHSMAWGRSLFLMSTGSYVNGLENGTFVSHKDNDPESILYLTNYVMGQPVGNEIIAYTHDIVNQRYYDNNHLLQGQETFHQGDQVIAYCQWRDNVRQGHHVILDLNGNESVVTEWEDGVIVSQIQVGLFGDMQLPSYRDRDGVNRLLSIDWTSRMELTRKDNIITEHVTFEREGVTVEYWLERRAFKRHLGGGRKTQSSKIIRYNIGEGWVKGPLPDAMRAGKPDKVTLHEFGVYAYDPLRNLERPWPEQPVENTFNGHVQRPTMSLDFLFKLKYIQASRAGRLSSPPPLSPPLE